MADLHGSAPADWRYRAAVATLLGAGESVRIMEHLLAVRSVSGDGERLDAVPDHLWRAVVASGAALESAIEDLLRRVDADLGERVALLTEHLRDSVDEWLVQHPGHAQRNRFNPVLLPSED